MTEQTRRDLEAGFAAAWRAHDVMTVGWGFPTDDPEQEAELAVNLCRTYDLDGYIADCEDPYEFAGAWRSKPFVETFVRLAPRAPLALSYIGDGYPYRQLDWTPWVKAGAAFMPQCYWGTFATSIFPSLWAAQRAALPLGNLCFTLGTSTFDQGPYPPGTYRQELEKIGAERRFNTWLLESTKDDDLRALLA